MTKILGTSTSFTGSRKGTPQDRSAVLDYSYAASERGDNWDWLWPRSCVGLTNMASGNAQIFPSWEDVWDCSVYADPMASEAKMGQRRLQVSGVARDAGGIPLAGVTVKAFDVVYNSLVDSVVSDANGRFTISTPYDGVQVYLWLYKAGTPVSGGSALLTPA